MILLGILILSITTAKAQLIECPNLKISGVCTAGLIKDEKLTSISPNILDGFPDLKNLHVELSNCSHINFSKAHQNLEILNILDTPLTVLRNNTFVGLLNLLSMELHDTSLAVLEPDVFYGLKMLHVLSISGHQIKHLPPTIFDPLVNISIIKIYNGKLRNIDMDLFRNNLNLDALILTGNQIWRVTGFLNHPIDINLANNSITDWKILNVFHLEISKNRLSEIFIGAVTGILHARNNKISEIYCQQTGSYNLKKLGLSNNEIKVLTCLEKMELLEYLDVSRNDLAHLSSVDFQNNPLMKSLRIHGNKFSQLDIWDMLKIPRFVLYIDNFIIVDNFGGPVVTKIDIKYCNTSCAAYENIFPKSQMLLPYLDYRTNLTFSCHCRYNVRDTISSTINIYMKRTFDEFVMV
jgi:Leucine-rich repeat (LRR) protein